MAFHAWNSIISLSLSFFSMSFHTKESAYTNGKNMKMDKK